MNGFGGGFGNQGNGNGFGGTGFGQQGTQQGFGQQGNGFGNQGGNGFGQQNSQQGFGGTGFGNQGGGFGNQQGNQGGFGQGAQNGFGNQGNQPNGQGFAQKNLGQNFNLLGPVNGGAVDVNKQNAIRTIMTGADSAINNIILKLVSEHASRRPDINDLFKGIDYKGCSLDIAYKTGIPMCPTFTLSRNLGRGTAAGGGFFGPAIGGLTVNGMSANQNGPRNESGPAMKMEIIISKFVEATDILKDCNLNESFEIRTPGCNLNYIAQTGTIMLTPSTLVLNNNKNDARKIASNI